MYRHPPYAQVATSLVLPLHKGVDRQAPPDEKGSFQRMVTWVVTWVQRRVRWMGEGCFVGSGCGGAGRGGGGGAGADTETVSESLGLFIVSKGVDTYLKMLLKDNLMHADLHPGNILFQRGGAGAGPRIVLVLNNKP